MTTEIQAAEAVVEAKVEAEVAKNEAVAASVAAVAAEGAAAQALDAARTVEVMAERTVDQATLDAEQRIAKFSEEVGTCRMEIESLRSQLAEIGTLNQSISAELSALSWLKEIETTALPRKAPPSLTSSATAGDTSAEGDGKTKKPEQQNGAPVKTPEELEREAEAARAQSTSTEQKKETPAKAARHRWL